MRHTVMRVAVIAVVALGFLSAWASIAFSWPSERWLAPIGYALLVIAVVVALVRYGIRRKRHTRASTIELYASDDYSDLQLGRRPITHYPRDVAATSQIGAPLHHDDAPAAP